MVSISQVVEAHLRGLSRRFTDRIGIKFHVPEDPLHAVAVGTGIALKHLDQFNFLMRSIQTH